jgi:SSS family solute:Na+ symporter
MSPWTPTKPRNLSVNQPLLISNLPVEPPVFNTVNGFDYALIALYFVIIIYVGFYAAKRNKNTDDYFEGGGQIPWFLAGLSNWVSGFSAFMFVAAAGFTYQWGIGAALLFTSATWAYLVGFLYFAKMWRRCRLSSPLQFLTRRFSPSTTYFYSLTAVIPAVVGIGQGLYILCIFVSTALGLNDASLTIGSLTLSGFQVLTIVTGFVMVLYTAVGGLWAAVLSDAVQGIIIGVMTLIILPVSYLHLGQGSGLWAGIQRLLAEVPADYFTLAGPASNPWFLIGYVINMMLGYNVAWHLVQRYNSVPDERGARKMALLCCILSLIGPLMWILPVMAARVIFPDMGAIWPQFANPAEASFVSLALLLLPHGMIGFVVSAILSATLGQANDAFNWLAATITRDIVVPLRRRLSGKTLSERAQLRVAWTTMTIVGVLGVAVAFVVPRFGGAFQFALVYFSLAAAFQMPVALGMIFRRTPWWSAIAASSAALIVAITLMVLGVWPEHDFARNMIVEAVVASIVFGLSALWFNPDDPRHAGLVELERDLQTPVESTPGQYGGAAMHVYGLIGGVCLILGTVLVACTFLPGTIVAPARINLIAGAMLLALGYGLRRLANRPQPTA